MIIDGRKVLLKSSVGSVNYNLTNKDSDKDCEAPTSLKARGF